MTLRGDIIFQVVQQNEAFLFSGVAALMFTRHVYRGLIGSSVFFYVVNLLYFDLVMMVLFREKWF